jgi:hypothetical protein
VDAPVLAPGQAAPAIEWTTELPFHRLLDQLPSLANGITAEVRMVALELSSPVDLDFVDRLEVDLSQGTRPGDGGGSADTGLACTSPGVAMPLATYQAPLVPVATPVLPLALDEPGLNLFDCLKREKTTLHFRLIPRVGATPARDAPLAMRACIGAAVHTRFP